MALPDLQDCFFRVRFNKERRHIFSEYKIPSSPIFVNGEPFSMISFMTRVEAYISSAAAISFLTIRQLSSLTEKSVDSIK